MAAEGGFIFEECGTTTYEVLVASIFYLVKKQLYIWSDDVWTEDRHEFKLYTNRHLLSDFESSQNWNIVKIIKFGNMCLNITQELCRKSSDLTNLILS